MKSSNELPQHDLSVSETCSLLNVTSPTVYKLMAHGKLDSYSVGRSRRITYESVARLRNPTNQLKK